MAHSLTEVEDTLLEMQDSRFRHDRAKKANGTVTDRGEVHMGVGLETSSFEAHKTMHMQFIQQRHDEAHMTHSAKSYAETISRRAEVRKLVHRVTREDSNFCHHPHAPSPPPDVLPEPPEPLEPATRSRPQPLPKPAAQKLVVPKQALGFGSTTLRNAAPSPVQSPAKLKGVRKASAELPPRVASGSLGQLNLGQSSHTLDGLGHILSDTAALTAEGPTGGHDPCMISAGLPRAGSAGEPGAGSPASDPQSRAASIGHVSITGSPVHTSSTPPRRMSSLSRTSHAQSVGVVDLLGQAFQQPDVPRAGGGVARQGNSTGTITDSQLNASLGATLDSQYGWDPGELVQEGETTQSRLIAPGPSTQGEEVASPNLTRLAQGPGSAGGAGATPVPEGHSWHQGLPRLRAGSRSEDAQRVVSQSGADFTLRSSGPLLRGSLLAGPSMRGYASASQSPRTSLTGSEMHVGCVELRVQGVSSGSPHVRSMQAAPQGRGSPAPTDMHPSPTNLTSSGRLVPILPPIAHNSQPPIVPSQEGVQHLRVWQNIGTRRTSGDGNPTAVGLQQVHAGDSHASIAKDGRSASGNLLKASRFGSVPDVQQLLPDRPAAFSCTPEPLVFEAERDSSGSEDRSTLDSTGGPLSIDPSLLVGSSSRSFTFGAMPNNRGLRAHPTASSLAPRGKLASITTAPAATSSGVSSSITSLSLQGTRLTPGADHHL